MTVHAPLAPSSRSIARIVPRLFAAGLTLLLSWEIDDVAAPAAQEVVELQVRGKYFSAPATVPLLITIEPHAANRTLRVEADGDGMFRSTEVALAGVAEKRVHEVAFTALPEGRYELTATVLSTDGVRGMATASVEVVSTPR